MAGCCVGNAGVEHKRERERERERERRGEKREREREREELGPAVGTPRQSPDNTPDRCHQMSSLTEFGSNRRFVWRILRSEQLPGTNRTAETHSESPLGRFDDFLPGTRGLADFPLPFSRIALCLVRT